MARFDAQPFSIQSVFERFISSLDLQRLGAAFGAIVTFALLASALLSSDLSSALVAIAFGLLVAAGFFAIIGFATGYLSLKNRATNSVFGDMLLENLPEGVLVTNRRGRVLFANNAYQQLSGNHEGEAPGIEEMFAGKVAAAEPVYRLMQAVKRGVKWREEFRVAGAINNKTSAHNEACWYRICVDTVKPDAALSCGSGFDQESVIWQVAEITSERCRQEEAFGKLQEIIDYLDQAPAGFFSADGNGRIDYLNDTLAKWLGLDLTDAVTSQLTLKDVVSGDGAMLLAQSPAKEKNDDLQTLDLDLVRHDGTLLPVRLLHQKINLENDGPQSRTFVLNRSPGAETSEDLRAAEVRFARFFHSAPIAIATLDAKGNMGSTNAAFARMFAASLVGKDAHACFTSLVNKDSREETADAVDAAINGRVRITPVNVSFGGDKEHTGQLFFSPVSSIGADRNEKFSGAILYAIDTTHQRSQEMQMIQGQKMQTVGQLAGGIAHDFNNLLTAIILGTDELIGRHKATDPGFRDIISIKQNANRAASLVSQILAFSRRQTMRPKMLNLNDSISNLSMLLDRLIGDNIKLSMERSRDLWMVRADVTQLEQVIMNLAVNARDAMPAGGVLTIATRNVSQRETAQMQDQGMQVGEYVLVQVSDTGSGMTDEVREKVFEPFFTTKGVGKGTGLGLSTVYGIVKQTSGFIYIDSEVGEGASFRIYLPRYEATPEELVRQKAKARKISKTDITGNETILLVEDEEEVRGFSARALRKRGYKVYEAGTGVEALEVMEELNGRVDLVVSDVMMPEMDGPTMGRAMRRANPDMRIIFVSGFAQDVLDEEDDFIFMPKPYGLKQLAEKVKEVLA